MRGLFKKFSILEKSFFWEKTLEFEGPELLNFSYFVVPIIWSIWEKVIHQWKIETNI